MENAWLKSPTLLVSQSPMSPHLVVAAAVSVGRFCTQSHEASLNCASVSYVERRKKEGFIIVGC
jgi:hypothetical protein